MEKRTLVDKAKEIFLSPEVKQQRARFLKAYELAMLNWHQLKKGRNGKSPPPPVYKDDQGYFRWANRKQRRSAEAKARRQKK